jgi:iron(III) transport system ATP-binding protein
MPTITVENLTKKFGEVKALDRVNLRVQKGELFFLLGPSGCGKTTLLRHIAGFYTPEEGRILFDDDDVTSVPPHKRNTGMMFQSYALWPHMTVAKNVAFGLEERRVPRAEIKTRVARALSDVRMEAYADRKIAQLSGGQQQRIALARALVIRPRCLLLDEPLSNLDAKLRLEMRSEIRRIKLDLKKRSKVFPGIALRHLLGFSCAHGRRLDAACERASVRRDKRLWQTDEPLLDAAIDCHRGRGEAKLEDATHK